MGIKITYRDEEIREMFGIGDDEWVEEIEVYYDNILKEWVFDCCIGGNNSDD